MNPQLKAQLDELVTDNDVVLFMKGRRRLPQCGFSARVVGMLDELLPDYKTVNVLESPEMREGIKAYSQWPTIPQLYIKGEFVGGCDIVSSMFENGDLQKTLGVEVPEVEEPTVTVTAGAKAALAGAAEAEGPGHFVRFKVDARFRPGLDIDTPKGGDFQVDAGGITLLIDRGSAMRSNGVTIDFVDGDSGGFKIDNPNEPPRVKTLEAKELKAKMDAGDALHLFDVRTEEERARGKIADSRLLDDAANDAIMALDQDDAVLVFYCHHGQRSMAAAQHYLEQGFKKVFNVRGGIEAWARDVDSSVTP